jgi:hypothetical protein
MNYEIGDFLNRNVLFPEVSKRESNTIPGGTIGRKDRVVIDP